MNRVHLIDCMEFMKALPDNHYDLAIVDPPYREENNPTAWMLNHSDMTNFGPVPNDAYFDELARISVNQIIWGVNNFGLKHKGFIVWDKKIRGYRRYSWAEVAMISEGLATVSTICQIGSDDYKFHPTQKPVSLYKWLLQNYAKPGQTIFDSHVGSGSIRIACHDLGFDFEGCEIDADYWKAQEQRFQTHAAQVQLFEPAELTAQYAQGDLL